PRALPDPPAPLALACRAPLGGHLALAAAHGTGTGHREAPLAERNRSAPFALGTRRDRRARRRPVAAARRADLAHGQRDGNFAPQGGHAERNRDCGLDLLVRLNRAVRAAPAEDRGEEIAEPAERPEVRKVEVGAESTGSPWPARAPVSLPSRPASRERSVAAQL